MYLTHIPFKEVLVDIFQGDEWKAKEKEDMGYQKD